MLTLTSCPECGAPAEITECFTLASTDGPVVHLAVSCLAGRHYRLPADKLLLPESPAPSRRPSPAPLGLARPSLAHPSLARPRPACSMVMSTLGRYCPELPAIMKLAPWPWTHGRH